MAIKFYAGKYLDDYTYEDLMKLKRKQLMELFCLLDPPGMSEIHGEYRAFLLDSGYIVNSCLSRMYLHFTWGNWQCKGFEPLGEMEGRGYNTFITTQSRLYENYFAASFMKIMTIVWSLFRLNSPQRIARIMLNKTSIVSSVFDGRPSFQLSYREYNTFYTNTMTDEVRKVKDHLYLCVGRLAVTFGKYNPMPFMLVGPPDPWVGPDIPYPVK